MSNKFSVSKRISSFKYAFNGIRILLKEEHNSRIHVIAGIICMILGIYLKLQMYEWISILFCIGFVITIEILNTAIENIADFINPKVNEKIKIIKDLGAAAVLISAITSLVIGIIIFSPKILIEIEIYSKQ